MTKKSTEIKTLSITPAIINKLNDTIKNSLDFEGLTGKQLNITSIVGEILTSDRLKLKIVVNDLNEGFDAIDSDNKTVQIKTRRYKGVESALTGSMLDKHFKVSYDYAVLTLLNKDYSFKELFRIEATSIQEHFDRINSNRIAEGKAKRKTMSISQFRTIANDKSKTK